MKKVNFPYTFVIVALNCWLCRLQGILNELNIQFDSIICTLLGTGK